VETIEGPAVSSAARRAISHVSVHKTQEAIKAETKGKEVQLASNAGKRAIFHVNVPKQEAIKAEAKGKEVQLASNAVKRAIFRVNVPKLEVKAEGFRVAGGSFRVAGVLVDKGVVRDRGDQEFS